jgi:hypothetical protein
MFLTVAIDTPAGCCLPGAVAAVLALLVGARG